MALNFDITGDNSNFLRKLEEVKRGVDDTSRYIEREGGNIDAIFGNIAMSAAAIGVGLSLKDIVSNVATIRGQFQQLEVAFKTMLGGEKEADALMQQLVRTAATTPFDLQSVANGAKQLLAYGENVDNVNDDLIRLGNIAAGLSQPLGDLVYLYGTTMTQGRLYTQDFNQFTGRGIPMVKELAKQFNVAESEVKGLVEEGKVGFPEVQKVIQSLTNEGGKFYNLMEEQSKTITGQISNIGDSIDMMFNNLGKQSEGVINASLSGVSFVVDNYEKIGKTLLELTVTYGAYRAVLIAVTAMQRVHTAVMEQAIVEKQLAALANITLSESEAVAAARTKLFTAALKDNSASLLSNPYAMAAVSVVALGYGIYKLSTYQTDSEKAQSKLNDALDEMNRASLSEQRELAKLKGELSALTKGTDEYNAVKDKIVKGYGKYYNGLDAEISKVGLTEQAYRKLTDAIMQSFGARQYEKFKNSQTEELDSTVSDNLEKLQKRLIDKLGEESGSYFYTKIRDGILKGTLKAGKGLDIVGLDKNTQKALDLASGASSNDFVRNKYAEGYIRNIIRAQELSEKMDKEAKKRFGVDENPVNNNSKGNTGPTPTTYQQDVASAKSGWEKAKKVYLQIIKDQKSTSEQVKKAREDMEAAKKKYDDLTGTKSGKQSKEADRLANQKASQENAISSQNEKILDLEKRQSIDRQHQNEDLENQLSQSKIDAMSDGFEKEQAQRELNNKKEIQAIQRQKEDYIQAIIQSEKEKFDEEEELKSKQNPKYKKKTFDSSSISVDTSSYDAIEKNITTKQQNDQIKDQEKAWNEYFIKFGNYQQKRIAIIEKYNKQISQHVGGDKASLENEKQSELDALDNSIKNSTTLMGELFADASTKSVNEIQAIINKAEILMQYLEATKDAQGNANIGGKSVSKQNILDLGISDNSLNKLEMSADEVESLRNAIDKLKGTLSSKSPFKLFETQIGAAVKKIKQGGNKNISQGISDIGSAVSAFSPAVEQFGQDLGNIVGSDDLGNKISGIAGAIGGLGQTAVGVGQIMSGDIVGGAMSAVSGISKVVTSLDGLFGANYDKYNKAKEEYKSYIDILDDVIERQKEMVASLDNENATKSYEYAKSLLDKSAEAARALGKERLDAGSSAGSHSIGVRQRKDMSSQAWNEAKSALGSAFNQYGIGDGRMTGLFDLSVDQLKKLQDEAPTFWAKLDDDVRGYLEDIIKANKSAEELKDTLYENLTGISFDSLFDNFLDSLYDMKATSKDISNDMADDMRKSLIKAFAVENYKDKMKEWYTKWAEALKDGVISSDEQKSLDDLKDSIITGATESAKLINDQFGYLNDATSQEASSKGFQTMDQDTGNELKGRFTALQIAGEDIKNSMLSLLTVANNISVLVSDNNIVLSEIRNLMVSSNSYLEDIAGFSKKMYNEFGKRLENIENYSKIVAA